LNIFRYQERQLRRRSLRLDHLNPQTQEFSLPPGGGHGDDYGSDDDPESGT
jgi:hypothetical protein